MPRGRMLNKKISYDEKIGRLSLESKLLFSWIIPHLDVKGRFFANSEIIKGQVVPFVKELSVKKIPFCLKEIADLELIVLYGNGECKYLEYKGFAKNQTITESRETPSDIPPLTQVELKQSSSITQEQVKLSKDKISKVKAKLKIPFEDFWNEYDYKKGSKYKVERKWDNLNLETQKKIMKYLPAYKESTPDKKYRQYPATFLNNETWLDELTIDANNGKGKVYTYNEVIELMTKKGLKQSEFEFVSKNKWKRK